MNEKMKKQNFCLDQRGTRREMDKRWLQCIFCDAMQIFYLHLIFSILEIILLLQLQNENLRRIFLEWNKTNLLKINFEDLEDLQVLLQVEVRTWD